MVTRIKINEIEEKYELLAKKYLLHVKDIEMIFIESLVMFFGTEDIEITSEGVFINYLVHDDIQVYSDGEPIKDHYDAKVLRESVPLNSPNRYTVNINTEDKYLSRKKFTNVVVRGKFSPTPHYKRKYYNLRKDKFSKLLAYFNRECIRRGNKKIESYVDAILAENDYIIYGKIIERSDYHYVVQPMLSKNQPIRYIAPIRIERTDSARIPDEINILPIEIRRNTKQRDKDLNILNFKANFFSRKLAEVHLHMQIERLKKDYKIYTNLKVTHYDDGKLYIKDCSEKKELYFRIVGYFVDYFKRFGVKAIIKTKMRRK